MTYVYLHEENGQKEIICKGHAGYGQTGSDIICSAISILTYSFNRVCIELDRKNKLQLNTLRISDGLIHTLISDPTNTSSCAFFMLRSGLESLEDNYPENVKICLEWEDFTKQCVQ